LAPTAYKGSGNADVCGESNYVLPNWSRYEPIAIAIFSGNLYTEGSGSNFYRMSGGDYNTRLVSCTNSDMNSPTTLIFQANESGKLFYGTYTAGAD
jgi:hypothetical protein